MYERRHSLHEVNKTSTETHSVVRLQRAEASSTPRTVPSTHITSDARSIMRKVCGWEPDHYVAHADVLCSGHSDRDILIRVIVPYLVVELVFGIQFHQRFGVRIGVRNLDNRFRDLLAVLGAFVYSRGRRRS
jgi:hypothetical protein